MCFDKIFKSLVIVICLIGGSMGSLSFATNDYCNQWDLMQQAYCMAKYRDTYIDLWNTSKAVGNSFIRGSISISLFEWITFPKPMSPKQINRIKDNIDLVYGYLDGAVVENEEEVEDDKKEVVLTWSDVDDIIERLKEIDNMSGKIPKFVGKDLSGLVSELSGKIEKAKGGSTAIILELIDNITFTTDIGDVAKLKKNDSLVIRITRFILMLTVVLAVTMVIINGIQYITKSANGEDPSKTRWNLFYLAIGLLLALFSVVIINLFRSIGESSLKEIGSSSTYIQKQDKLPLA